MMPHRTACSFFIYFVSIVVLGSAHPGHNPDKPSTRADLVGLSKDLSPGAALMPDPLSQEMQSSATLQSDILNDRPIIGIISQELSRGMRRVFGHLNVTSYIAASYVKFVEAAGARVVPVLINQADDYYENLTNSLNGFLIPGGGASLKSSGYSRAAAKIYDAVKLKYLEGDILPIWATCLGFELVLKLEAGKYPLSRCNASNTADPLFFESDYKTSRLLGNMSEDLLEALATQNITANFHKYCVFPETFYKLGLNKSMRILSTSYSRNGIEEEYVSTVEHRKYSIFATQWHPEKAAFEWADDPKHDAIPHSIAAIRASQALAEFFVKEARKNRNRFSSKEEEQKHLIYNFSPVFVYTAYKSSFQQCYLFK